MAGAGFKDFAVGEVLTATDVDTYLMQQSVMRFASSASRTTALSGILAEGMISYLDDVNEVQFYNGSSWSAIDAKNPGIGTNVVSAIQTAEQTTTSTSFQNATSLVVTITPTSASSKILVIAHRSLRGTPGVVEAFTRVTRNGSAINGGAGRTEAGEVNDITNVILDSPATTSAVTYRVQFRSQGAVGTAYLCWTSDGVGSLTAIEVAV